MRAPVTVPSLRGKAVPEGPTHSDAALTDHRWPCCARSGHPERFEESAVVSPLLRGLARQSLSFGAIPLEGGDEGCV